VQSAVGPGEGNGDCGFYASGCHTVSHCVTLCHTVSHCVTLCHTVSEVSHIKVGFNEYHGRRAGISFEPYSRDAT
jgi:hypothetical protein